MSSSVIDLIASTVAALRASGVRAAHAFRTVFILDHASSIGLYSGEYGGRKAAWVRPALRVRALGRAYELQGCPGPGRADANRPMLLLSRRRWIKFMRSERQETALVELGADRAAKISIGRD